MYTLCNGETKRQKINYEANNDRNLTKLSTHCLDLYQNEVWQFFDHTYPPSWSKSVLCIESGVAFLSSPKSNQNSGISTAKFYYMTLIFGNFPETPGMSGSLENSQTSIFLHCLVCGNPWLKKFLVRSIKIKKTMCAGFWLFCCCFFCFFVFFCMIWSNFIIFSPPEHRKHHLNLKWGDLNFWFRPISCTHFATPQHIKRNENLMHLGMLD